jgi:PST family polysaccharide transporter
MLQAKLSEFSLLQRSISALGWNYLGTVVRTALQFILGILLARLLGPEPFGLVAIAWLILGLGNLVGDFGLASALVQQKEITDRDIRYVFTMQMLAGTIMTALIVIAAPWVAIFFKSTNATLVIQAMGCLFLIQAAGQTATSILRRHLDFKRLQTYGIGSYLVGYLFVGLPLAWSGAGAWSLVAAQVLQAVIYSALVNLHVHHSWIPTFKPDASGMLSFGSKILASNLTSWGISNLDSVIIGRVFGPMNLGFYNRGMNLVASPMNAFTSTLQGVLFPAYSRANGNINNTRSAYFASVGLISTIMVPAFAAIAVMPHTLIEAIYGEKWLQVVVLITPLALAMPVNAILAMGGPLMTGLGAAGKDAASQGVCVLVLVPAVWLASQVSLAAVAWTILVVYLLRALLVSYLALRLISGTWTQLLRALVGPMFLGLFAAMTAGLIDTAFMDIGSPMLRLCLGLGLSNSATALLLLWKGRYLLCAETISVVVKMAARFPRPLSNHIESWGIAR